MAEATVVKEALTPEMIALGKGLTLQLDKEQHPPSASLWLYRPDVAEWRLLMSLPDLPQTGPLDGYRRIQEAIKNQGDHLPIALASIELVEPNHPLLLLLRKAIRTGPGMSGIRFSRSVVDGVYVEDAYIYRL